MSKPALDKNLEVLSLTFMSCQLQAGEKDCKFESLVGEKRKKWLSLRWDESDQGKWTMYFIPGGRGLLV